MNNNELKNILNSIQPTKNEKDQMTSIVNSVKQLLTNNVGNIKIAEFHVGGSFAKRTIIKGRKEVDIVVAISPKDPRKFLYKDLANLNMNYIENTFYTQWYDKLANQDNDSKITRIYDRNALTMKTTQGVDIDFLIKFKSDQLLNVTDSKVENFYLERDTQQLNFINKANQEFTLFKGAIQLIKYFRNLESLHELKSYMIEIILYYSLCKYLNGKDYVSYLNAFLNGLTDFINEKTIEVTNDMYKYLKTKQTQLPSGRWKVIDVANRSNNVAEYVTSSNIHKFKDFHKKYNDELSQSVKKNQVNNSNTNSQLESIIDLYYEPNSNKQKWQWGFKIPDYEQRSGSFPINLYSNTEAIIDSLIIACQKCVRYVVNHKKVKELKINLRQDYYDIFKNNKYDNKIISERDIARIRTLIAYAKKHGIAIIFISVK